MDKFIKIWINSKEPKDVDKIKPILHTALLSEFPKHDVKVGDTFQNQVYRHYAAKIVVHIPVEDSIPKIKLTEKKEDSAEK